MTRVGAIDCGTNSVRLLIADVDGGEVVDVLREVRIVRLGEAVDRTGRLLPEAIDRTRVALNGYAQALGEHGVQRMRMVATSAVRDAGNRADFEAMVRAVLGVDPEVVSGETEAALALRGATSALPDLDGPVVVLDLGGGSTELVRRADGREAGREAGGRVRAHSMDVGSVRLTERHLHDDPPTAAQVAAVEADVRVALTTAAADVAIRGDEPVVGVAATVVTMAALALGLADYRPGALHGAAVTTGEIDRATERLLAMPRAERLAHPVIHPGRVDVLAAGAVVLQTVLHGIGAERLTVSEHDILDGIALGLADGQLT